MTIITSSHCFLPVINFILDSDGLNWLTLQLFYIIMVVIISPTEPNGGEVIHRKRSSQL